MCTCFHSLHVKGSGNEWEGMGLSDKDASCTNSFLQQDLWGCVPALSLQFAMVAARRTGTGKRSITFTGGSFCRQLPIAQTSPSDDTGAV